MFWPSSGHDLSMNNFTFTPRPTRPLTENFSLNYEEIKVTYVEAKHDQWVVLESASW